MFIPPSSLKDQFTQQKSRKSPIRLQADHILIEQAIVAEIFGEDKNVYMVYYPEKRSLLIAPISDDLFKKLHKASQHLLKEKNLKGDKSIALHEILIDNQINQEDRDLEYKAEPALGILNIQL